jgi:hypothetical protein
MGLINGYLPGEFTHGIGKRAFYADTHILKFFKILKAMIENAPAPR